MTKVPRTTTMHSANNDALYHWAVLPDCYFATALLVCDCMLRGWSMPQNMLAGSLKDIRTIDDDPDLPTPHPMYELIRPAIFNFKHGIELYIKGLGCLDFVQYANSHDLQELFCIAIQYASQEVKEILKELQRKAWPVIEPYYIGSYISTQMATRSDVLNAAERYPEVDPKKSYQVPDPYAWVTPELVGRVRKDIRTAARLLDEAKDRIYEHQLSGGSPTIAV